MRNDASPAAPAGGSDRAAAAALFVTVLAARLWLIRSAGSPVPFWDQWDAEALALYRPWLDGSLVPAALFAPHNEHRIVLTRLADLALFAAGGGWNPWGQLLLNAVLHAACAAGLCATLPRTIGAVRALTLGGLALLFAVPAGWQNALWGFQSQVLFGNLLAVGALAGLVATAHASPRWWAGWLCALLALFATGAGPFVAAAALPFILMSSAPEASNGRRSQAGPALAVGALLAAGAWLQVTVPAHTPLRAAGLAQFLSVLLHGLAWPWVDTPWLAPVMQAPGLWLVWRLLRDRRRPDAGERLLLALLLWSWLHAAAIAWSRGAGLPGGRPLSRYQDPLVVGAAVQLIILLRLAAAGPRARVPGLLWGGCMLAGLLALGTHVLSVNLPYKRWQDREGLARIRGYLAAGDPSALGREEPSFPILHPDTAVVQRVLDDPVLRPVLPREFTDPAAPAPWLVRHATWLPWPALAALLFAAWPRKLPRRPP